MKENYNIETRNLITLCHIIDNFEEFEQKLLSVISPKYNRNFVFQLWDISEGKFKLGAKKAKKFYKENKSIIDTINKYSNIPTFINLSYSYYGKPDVNLHFFYQYLNKNEIDKILSILERLKELGFTKFNFDENLDFTKEIYDTDSNFRYNREMIYVDNIEVIPHYQSYIKYRTTHSNYKMKLKIIGEDFSEYGREITLNSLLFDANRLPEKIDKETIFDPILKLKEEQDEKSTSIRNSVDLSVSISDLETSFGYSANTISRLEGVKNKKELIDILLNIKLDIEKLKKLSSEYNSSISESTETLTSEILEKEKTSYIRRREWQRMDLD